MTLTAANVRAFAADPMEFFASVTIPRAMGDCRLRDCWVPFQVDGFRVLADCVKAIAVGQSPPYRGLWIERTKGASKDSDVGLALLWLLMFARRPQTIELGADDFDQIEETLKAMQEVVRVNRWMESRVTALKTKIVCEATASECLFLTCDSTGAHGSRPTCTVCNELSHCGSEAFISTMMDNADKIPNNLAIIATNAGTTDSWQHNWRENYRTNPAWFFQKIEVVAPWIDPAKVADAERRNPPSRFQRLWKGVWVGPGGDAVDEKSIAAAFQNDLQPQEHAAPEYEYVGGLDLGVTRDSSAVCILGVRRDRGDFGRIRLAAVKVWKPTKDKKVDLTEVENTLIKLNAAFHLKSLAFDPWQALHMAQRLQSTGLSVNERFLPKFHGQAMQPTRVRMVEVPATGSNLQKMASVLIETFNDRRLDCFDCPDLRRDLTKLRIEERSYGFRLTSPRDETGHGDLCSALSLALLGTSELAGRRKVQLHDASRPPMPEGSTRSDAALAMLAYHQGQYDLENAQLKREHENESPFKEMMKRFGRF